MSPDKGIRIHSSGDVFEAKAGNIRYSELRGVAKILTLLVIASGLTSCASQAIDSIANESEVADWGDLVPTPTTESGTAYQGVVAQVYQSTLTDVVATHFYSTDSDGNPAVALSAVLSSNAEVNVVEGEGGVKTVEVSGNVLGDPDDHSDSEDTTNYVLTESGDGYQTTETMSNEEASEWFGGMDTGGNETMAKTLKQITDYIENNPELDIPVITAATPHINPQDQLVDMRLNIVVTLGDTTVTLVDTMKPLESTGDFENMQIATTTVSSGDNGYKVNYSLVPSDWSELTYIDDSQISQSVFVSPEFVDLQTYLTENSVTLTPDGVLEQNGESVPNTLVTVYGEVIIEVDGETLMFGVEDVAVDEEGGISVGNYVLNENGEWVEAETSTVVNGLEIVLGDKVGEYTLITDFPYPDNIEGNQGAMDKYDAVRNAFADLFPEAQWVQGPDGSIVFMNLETQTEYAAYERVSELYEKYDFIVDWNKVVFALLSEISVVFERDSNGNNIDEVAARLASDKLFQINLRDVSLMGYEDYFGLTLGSTICTPNGRECVFATFSDLNRVAAESKRGVVTIFNSDGKTTSSFVAKNFEKDK